MMYASDIDPISAIAPSLKMLRHPSILALLMFYCERKSALLMLTAARDGHLDIHGYSFKWRLFKIDPWGISCRTCFYFYCYRHGMTTPIASAFKNYYFVYIRSSL
jgi:hypothetical protein